MDTTTKMFHMADEHNYEKCDCGWLIVEIRENRWINEQFGLRFYSSKFERKSFHLPKGNVDYLQFCHNRTLAQTNHQLSGIAEIIRSVLTNQFVFDWDDEYLVHELNIAMLFYKQCGNENILRNRFPLIPNITHTLWVSDYTFQKHCFAFVLQSFFFQFSVLLLSQKMRSVIMYILFLSAFIWILNLMCSMWDAVLEMYNTIRKLWQWNFGERMESERNFIECFGWCTLLRNWEIFPCGMLSCFVILCLSTVRIQKIFQMKMLSQHRSEDRIAPSKKLDFFSNSIPTDAKQLIL